MSTADGLLPCGTGTDMSSFFFNLFPELIIVAFAITFLIWFECLGFVSKTLTGATLIWCSRYLIRLARLKAFWTSLTLAGAWILPFWVNQNRFRHRTSLCHYESHKATERTTLPMLLLATWCTRLLSNSIWLLARTVWPLSWSLHELNLFLGIYSAWAALFLYPSVNRGVLNLSKFSLNLSKLWGVLNLSKFCLNFFCHV